MIKRSYLLFGLLLLSILVRLPNIDRPISKHHEFCNAITLLTFDVWNEKGAANFHYSPVTNYQNPTDLHINNGTIPFLKEGTHYYLSHPPLGFWLPYYSLQFLSLTHSNHHLQWFNLLFHLLAALCVFSITEMLIKNRKRQTTSIESESSVSPSLIAAGVYLFSPAMLWYGCNVYFSDIFVGQLFVLSVWAMLKSNHSLQEELQKKRPTSKSLFSKKYAYLLFGSILVFATVLTEWIGYFLVASVGLQSIYAFFKHPSKAAKRYYALQMILMTLVGLGGIGVTLWVYSDILGAEAFLQYLKNRFVTRTGQLDNEGGKLAVWFFYFKQLLQHYASAYLPVLLLLFVLLWANYFHSPIPKRDALQPKNAIHFNAYFWWIALPPVLLHHFLFINYTAIHEYAIVKMALPLSVWMALLYHRIEGEESKATVRKYVHYTLPVVFLLCLTQYFYINRVDDYSWRGHRYDQFERLGTEIRQTAKPEEMVFVEGDIEINFQLVYYAKRNIWRYESPEQMQAVLKHFGHETGRIYRFDE